MDTMTDRTHLIFAGGDERLDILEDGNNKYHVNPLHYQGLFHRGSCTCSTVNPLTAQVLERDIDLENPRIAIQLRQQQEQRLKKLLNYEGKDAFSCIFAPSGSDLAYLPPLFSKILYPEKEILIILTCPEELGSGSQMAYLTKYYANRTQFGSKVEKGDDLNMRYDVDLARFRARNDDGHINNCSEKITSILSRYPEKSKIGALVIGSKSGIEDDISVIPNIDKEVLWVVDLCQFRNSKKLVNHLLRMGCMVMLTGSKFYMAPPFCGVMLVPKSLTVKLNQSTIQPSHLEGFDKIFSYYDFSSDFPSIREHFPKDMNKGLLLRWEIALDEMERFNTIERKKSEKIIKSWNKFVRDCITNSKNLELMPHQEKTNDSIISFRVKSRFGTYLNYDELKIFYQEMTDERHELGQFHKIFFGQPVKYSMGAFIRVAIGAYNIYELLQEDKATRFDNDRKMIGILNEGAERFM